MTPTAWFSRKTTFHLPGAARTGVPTPLTLPGQGGGAQNATDAIVGQLAARETVTFLAAVPLTAAQLSRLLGVSESTVCHWRKRHGMPCTGLGRTSYGACMAWLGRNRQMLTGKGWGARSLERVRKLVDEWTAQERS